jgi:hypothetical protein
MAGSEFSAVYICNGSHMAKSLKYKKPRAYKHGAFAKDILPGEDSREFYRLHAGLIAEWQPDGATEDEIVLSMVQNRWAKRRMHRFTQLLLLKNASDPHHPSYDEAFCLASLAAFLEAEPETAFQTYAHHLLRARKLDQLNRSFPQSNFTTNSDRAQAIIHNIKAELADRPSAPEWLDVEGMFQTFDSISIERLKLEIELADRLDGAFNRQIKMLVQAKSWKQMLRETTKAENTIVASPANGGAKDTHIIPAAETIS